MSKAKEILEAIKQNKPHSFENMFNDIISEKVSAMISAKSEEIFEGKTWRKDREDDDDSYSNKKDRFNRRKMSRKDKEKDRDMEMDEEFGDDDILDESRASDLMKEMEKASKEMEDLKKRIAVLKAKKAKSMRESYDEDDSETVLSEDFLDDFTVSLITEKVMPTDAILKAINALKYNKLSGGVVSFVRGMKKYYDKNGSFHPNQVAELMKIMRDAKFMMAKSSRDKKRGQSPTYSHGMKSGAKA